MVILWNLQGIIKNVLSIAVVSCITVGISQSVFCFNSVQEDPL